MNELLTPTFLIILLFSTIRTATPLIFAALGGMFSERAGVINIALEGLMLSGAFTAAVVTYELQNPYIGFLAGVISGALLALVFAVAVIKFEADQVVAGFAVSLLMIGLPAVISARIYDSAGSTQQIAKEFLLPDFYNRLSIASILAFALVPICWYVLYKTPFGLRLRAAGENPAALYRCHIVRCPCSGGRRVSFDRAKLAVYTSYDGRSRLHRTCRTHSCQMETGTRAVRVSFLWVYRGTRHSDARRHKDAFR